VCRSPAISAALIALASGCGARTETEECQVAFGSAGAGDVIAVSAGTNTACALRRWGDVVCWGHDAFRHLRGPTQVPGLRGATALSVGPDGHRCAVLASGGVACWGQSDRSEFGDGEMSSWETPPELSDEPVPVVDLTDAVQVSAGWDHTCAADAYGAAYCWGANRSIAGLLEGRGRLGDGTDEDRARPTRVVELDDAVQVAAGFGHSCALRSDGSVACWGDNTRGQLGDGTFDGSLVPVEVGGLHDVVQLSAGFNANCALKADGSLWCWGDGGGGQLGDGSTRTSPSPVRTAGIADAVHLDVSNTPCCAVRCTGDVACWAEPDHFPRGGPVWVRHLSPREVSWVTDAVSIAPGFAFVCALRRGGEVVCWGGNERGMLGDGTTEPHDEPVVVDMPL
jgi:alpha-tubulin suppressor-like RCC1 family protein